jgi:hypothetical protein
MKKLGTVFFALAVVSFGVFSCQKTLDQSMDRNDVDARVTLPEGCEGPYSVTLESKVKTDAGWMWTWRIVNPNPGNGNDGTVQELSHFNVVIPICDEGVTVLSTAYKADGSTEWTSGPTVPSVDASIVNTCDRNHSEETIKFDLDKNGYIRVEIAEDYQPGVMYGYYKSGNTTGCGRTCFEGISCLKDNPPPPNGCSFSQGFWFAKPISEANAWPADFTMGGKSYTQQEGKAIFFVSGNNELKRAFTQAATIKLSIATGYLTDPSGIIGTVNQVEALLTGLPKLSAANITTVNRGLTSGQRRNLGTWAGAIGNYVDANHCEINP